MVAGGAPNIAAWLSAAFAPDASPARTAQTYAARRNVARARLVGPEVIGERLELRRERGGIAAVGEHVELQSARRQAPGIEGDGPRERLERARRVAFVRAACSATRIASAAPRPGSVSVASRSDAIARRGPCRPSARRCGCARRRPRPRRGDPRRRPVAPASSAARSRIAAASASCPSSLRASAARIHASTMRAGCRTHAGTPSASPRAAVGDGLLHRARRAPSRATACSSARVRTSSLSAMPGCSRTRLSRSAVAVHVACDSNERASWTSDDGGVDLALGRAHAGAVEEEQRAPRRDRSRASPARASASSRVAASPVRPASTSSASHALARSATGAPATAVASRALTCASRRVRRRRRRRTRRASGARGPSRRARSPRSRARRPGGPGSAGCGASRAAGRAPRAARGTSNQRCTPRGSRVSPRARRRRAPARRRSR